MFMILTNNIFDLQDRYAEIVEAQAQSLAGEGSSSLARSEMDMWLEAIGGPSKKNRVLGFSRQRVVDVVGPERYSQLSSRSQHSGAGTHLPSEYVT